MITVNDDENFVHQEDGGNAKIEEEGQMAY